jgi:hypothetical protein
MAREPSDNFTYHMPEETLLELQIVAYHLFMYSKFIALSKSTCLQEVLYRFEAQLLIAPNLPSGSKYYIKIMNIDTLVDTPKLYLEATFCTYSSNQNCRALPKTLQLTL